MRKIFILFPLGMLLFMVACGKSASESAEMQSHELYTKSVNLLNHYTDSIRQMKDSAGVNRLDESLANALTNLNYEYTSEADPGITESQNDTLVRLNTRFVALRDSLLDAFSHNTHLATDTIETESEAVRSGADR